MKKFSEYIRENDIKSFTVDDLVNYIRDYFFRLTEEYNKEIEDYKEKNNVDSEYINLLCDIYNVNHLMDDYTSLLNDRKIEKKLYKRKRHYINKQIDAAAYIEFKTRAEDKHISWNFNNKVRRLYEEKDELEKEIKRLKQEIEFLKKQLDIKNKKLCSFKEKLNEVYDLEIEDVQNDLKDIYKINQKFFNLFNNTWYIEFLLNNDNKIVKDDFIIRFFNRFEGDDYYLFKDRDMSFNNKLFNLDYISDNYYLDFRYNKRDIVVNNVFKNYDINCADYNNETFYIIKENQLIDKIDVLKLIKKEIEYDKNNQKNNFSDYSFNYIYNKNEWSNDLLNSNNGISVKQFLESYYKEIERIQYLYRSEVSFSLDLVSRDLLQILGSNLIEVYELDNFYRKVDNGKFRSEHISKILDIEDALIYAVNYDNKDIALTVDLDKKDIHVTFSSEDKKIDFIINENKENIVKDFEKTFSLEEDKQMEIIREVKNKYNSFLSLHNSIELDNGYKLRFYMSDQCKFGDYVFDGYEWNRDVLTVEVWNDDKLLDKSNIDSMDNILLEYFISNDKVNEFMQEISNIDKKEKDYKEIYKMLDELKEKEDKYRKVYGRNIPINKKIKITNEFLFDSNRQIREELLDKLDYFDFSEIDFEGAKVSEELLDKIKSKQEEVKEDDFVREYYEKKKIMMKKRG